MAISEENKCSNCGAEMVSQKKRYQIGGIAIIVLAVGLAIIGIVRLIDEGSLDGIITIIFGSIFLWLGLRRARSNPWYCPKCKTREFK